MFGWSGVILRHIPRARVCVRASQFVPVFTFTHTDRMKQTGKGGSRRGLLYEEENFYTF